MSRRSLDVWQQEVLQQLSPRAVEEDEHEIVAECEVA